MWPLAMQGELEIGCVIMIMMIIIMIIIDSPRRRQCHWQWAVAPA